jgi:hypothetical protein
MPEDVEDRHDGDRPQPDRGEERTVPQKQLFGTAPFILDVHEVKVAKDPVQDKWNRRHHRMVLGQILRGECIEGIGDHRARGRD